VIGNQVGQFPLAVAVGDLNHDGKLDLVVVAAAELSDGTKGFVDVLLGNGDGTFQPAVVTPINSDFPAVVNGYPVGIALADLNGDGYLDIVTTNPTLGGVPGSVSVLLGNGDGSFREMSDPNVGTSTVTSVAVGDVNNDHIPDLVANGADLPGVVSVLLGNGDGTFQTPQILTAPVLNTVTVALGDFNHEGNLDIATANRNFGGSGTMTVFLGNGNGTFPAALNFPFGANESTAMAVGDFNRDGFPDIAVAGGSSNTLVVFINSGTWPALTTATPASALSGGFIGPLGTALTGPELLPPASVSDSYVGAWNHFSTELAQEGQLDAALPPWAVTAWRGADGPRTWFKKIMYKGRSGRPAIRSQPGSSDLQGMGRNLAPASGIDPLRPRPDARSALLSRLQPEKGSPALSMIQGNLSSLRGLIYGFRSSRTHP
jgi:hypothetical protein